jgi:methyltransferase (TIGR00027 family)
MNAPLPGVSRTAVWLAALRAAESARPDRLFDDHLAAAFAEAAAPGGGLSLGPPGASEFLAIRIRFYDEFLRTAGARQVVLLAAGLDSRAFRLDWPPGVRLFEVDLPELFSFKESVLASQGAVARCGRTVVAADLREDWARPLLAAGFDRAEPTAWLAEGLLPYLTMAECDALLSTIGTLRTAGDRLALDHMSGAADERAAVRETAETVRSMGASWKSTMDDPAGWLAGYGWQATTARVPELGERYGRPLPEFVDLAASNATILCVATGS